MIISFLALTIVVATAIAFATLRRRKEHVGASLLVFSFALLAWTITYSQSTSNAWPGGLFWLSLVYLCTAVTSTAVLAFTFDYTNHKQWLNWQGILLLAVEPLLVQILFWIGYQQEFFSVGGNISASFSASPLHSINAAYCDSLAIISVILLVQTFDHKPKQYLSQAIIITVGIFIPILIKIYSSLGFLLTIKTTSIPWGYTITGLFIVYGIFRYKLPELTLVARDMVVESMTEGWMVLDTHNRIVDINPAAETLIGLPRDKIYGQPAEEILKNWPNVYQDRAARDIEVKGSINLDGEWRYLRVRISPLDNQSKENIGKVILWRDVTDHRKSSEARQRAREEMFTLLHSISSAASRSLNVNDFLEESIYQIVYSFHSQAIAVFLMAGGNSKTGKEEYYLASHHGISPEEIDFLSSSPEVANVIKWIHDNQEPFTISDLGTNDCVPALFQGSNFKSLLVVPMIFENQVLGMIGLARGEGVPHGADEISRLTVLAEEIASLISSDRQRQMVIALEERQRVVRDLHDSITQKLYALVALTEAAQASLESGAVMQPAEVLARIGEHARHALKEMRLFLFELRPVDLENEGLVAILHQRLAAVEGLADIKARMVTDDKINLSLDKQVALYYIAQEALNNVLKHANAKTVSIHLVKRKGNVVLEIQDDGCGFMPKLVASKGGMGLGNMRERAVKVDGKLRIVSIPDKGTKVVVTVHKDKPIRKIQDTP